MVWTDSQDYGADEILYIARTALFNKTNQLIRETIILFEVYPQLFQLLKSEERINSTLTARLISAAPFAHGHAVAFFEEILQRIGVFESAQVRNRSNGNVSLLAHGKLFTAIASAGSI